MGQAVREGGHASPSMCAVVSEFHFSETMAVHAKSEVVVWRDRGTHSNAPRSCLCADPTDYHAGPTDEWTCWVSVDEKLLWASPE
jgi:hypothetical protein